jgi:hypothetical protein
MFLRHFFFFLNAAFCINRYRKVFSLRNTGIIREVFFCRSNDFIKIKLTDNCMTVLAKDLIHGTVFIDPCDNSVCMATTIPTHEDDVAVVNLETGYYYDIDGNAEVIIPQNAVLCIDR